MRTLIVVDMQNDFIDGALGTPEAQAIVPNVKKKIQEYWDRGDQIIFTRDTHFSNYLNTQEGRNLPVTHCVYNTDGWQIAPGLEVPYCDYVHKYSFGYDKWQEYFGEDFDNEIELVGLCTDICVISNAMVLKAACPEVKITVDASCCAGVTPESHLRALEAMKMCQISVIGE